MVKKFVIMALAVVAILCLQNSYAIGWGEVSVTSSETTTYVDKFGQVSLPMTIEYVPYFFGTLPAKVDIAVSGAPAWLTVIPSTPNFVLTPNTPKTVDLIIVPNQYDVVAGTKQKVTVSVSGQLVTGGLLRSLDPSILEVIVGFNPYTQISISSISPIERTSPDKELKFPVDIYNYGNTRVEVDIGFIEDGSGEWQKLISPSKIFIEPKQAGDETFPREVVYVTVTSPHGTAISYHNDWQDFSIKATARAFTPYYARSGGNWGVVTDDSFGYNYAEGTAYFLARNKGFYIPGFDALLLIAGLGLAGMLVYRKKK